MTLTSRWFNCQFELLPTSGTTSLRRSDLLAVSNPERQLVPALLKSTYVTESMLGQFWAHYKDPAYSQVLSVARTSCHSHVWLSPPGCEFVQLPKERYGVETHVN